MKNKVVIVTGRSGSGKTTFLCRLNHRLIKAGIQPAGFLAEGFWKDNKRSYFELVDLTSEDRILFCTKEINTGWNKHGQFYINPEAIELGERILDPGHLNKFFICVIDEIGPFELQGKGWYNAIHRIFIKLPELPMIWVVRESLIKAVVENFQLDEFNILYAKHENLETAVDKTLIFFGMGK